MSGLGELKEVKAMLCRLFEEEMRYCASQLLKYQRLERCLGSLYSTNVWEVSKYY